jgi:hypothetical protein
MPSGLMSYNQLEDDMLPTVGQKAGGVELDFGSELAGCLNYCSEGWIGEFLTERNVHCLLWQDEGLIVACRVRTTGRNADACEGASRLSACKSLL